MASKKDFLLNRDNDMIIKDGDFLTGESYFQEVAMILSLNQGDLKSQPMLGPNLVQLKKMNASKLDIQKRVRIHLAQDSKDYEDVKNNIKLNTND